MPVVAQRWHVRGYTAGDGLPAHHVEDVEQLGSGVMAFLTPRGLALYDGVQWEVETAPLAGMPPRPWHVAAGSGDDLWAYVGTGCWRRRDGRWERVTEAPLPSSHACAFRIQVAHDQDRLVVVPRTGAVRVFESGGWTTLEPSAGAQWGACRAAVMVGGRCLLGTDRGVFACDLGSGTYEALSVPAGRSGVHGMAHDVRNDHLWLIGEERITRVTGVASSVAASTSSYAAPARMRPRDPGGAGEPMPDSRWVATGEAACAAGLAGGLYFGDGFAIFYFNPKTGFEQLRVCNGLTTGGITCAMRDREGNMWLCGARGANKIVSRRWVSFDRAQGLFDDEVSSALQRADGSVVLGHGGGLTFFGTQPETRFLSADVVADRVMDLCEDADHNLWMAVGRMGLGRMDSDGELVFHELDPPENIVGVEVGDVPGEVWVASDRGLHRYGDEGWSGVPLVQGQERVQVRRLLSDPAGGLLMATAAHGVLSYRSGEVRASGGATSVVSNAFTVLRDSRGRVWAGTEGGLAWVRADGSLRLTERPHVDRPVYALSEDQDGRLWVGTDLGILCWDGSSVRRFSASDGVLGMETNRSAAIVTRDGRVWFGTDRGVSIYDRRFDLPHEHGPTITMGDLRAGGVEYSFADAVSIPGDTRPISFGFSAISFIDEDRVRIEKRLEGLEDGWSVAELGPSRRILYAILPAGEYRLSVRAVDADGVTSAEVTSPTLRIKAPIWAQTWFIVTTTAVLLLLTGGVVNAVAQRRYTGRLEREVEARAEEVRKLEREQEKLLRLESLGLLAGGIAHDFNNLLTAISGSVSLVVSEPGLTAEGRSILQDADTASWEARELASQLVTFSRGGAPIKEAADIGRLVQDCTSFSLRGSTVEPRFHIADDLWAVEVDTSQIGQVINNIVLNARDAMVDRGTLRVSVQDEGAEGSRRQVVMSFADDGPGMEPEVLARVFDPYFSTKEEGRGLGLATAFMIIQRHEGSLVATSEPGTGTTFTITLPATEAPVAKPRESEQRRPELDAKVLVMDDMDAIRMFTHRALSRAGCEVLESDDGARAVELYREALESGSRVDVVVMDLTVPGGMGGLAAAEAIREIDPEARIIVTSGYAENDVMADHRRHGFAARLPKPYRLNDLLRVVAEVLGVSVPR